jgi:hypothetical protein
MVKQIDLFPKQSKAYGGQLLNSRKGRASGRPLDTKRTMHLVLRSSKANGAWSFRNPKHSKKIREIVNKFSVKYGVRIDSLANVGNHLHFQIKLGNRYGYRPFIRAITAAIAMAITGVSRWQPSKGKFWDYRPFTRVVVGFKALLQLSDYIKLNQIEGAGFSRVQAHFILANHRMRRPNTS